MIVAPTMAKVLVKASGWNSFPSCPVKANTGIKARMMIAIEKKTGRPTSLVESRTVSHTFGRSFGSTCRFSRKRKAFSVTTIPASTKTPIAIAMPERDIRFELIPITFMNKNDSRTASGKGMVTIRIERKWARKIMWASVTRISSSIRARFRVDVARLMSWVRS